MKNKIVAFTLTGVMVAASLSSFSQDNKKVEKARANEVEAKKDLMEAKQDLREAKNDSAEDYLKFKKESEMKIQENQARINELKEKRRAEANDVNDDYNKKIMAIEEKNNKLRVKMQDADNTKTSNWSSFKREFNHDSHEIGQAFKNIGVNNEK